MAPQTEPSLVLPPGCRFTPAPSRACSRSRSCLCALCVRSSCLCVLCVRSSSLCVLCVRFVSLCVVCALFVSLCVVCALFESLCVVCALFVSLCVVCALFVSLCVVCALRVSGVRFPFLCSLFVYLPRCLLCLANLSFCLVLFFISDSLAPDARAPYITRTSRAGVRFCVCRGLGCAVFCGQTHAGDAHHAPAAHQVSRANPRVALCRVLRGFAHSRDAEPAKFSRRAVSRTCALRGAARAESTGARQAAAQIAGARPATRAARLAWPGA
jgi:hypothetical protein